MGAKKKLVARILKKKATNFLPCENPFENRGKNTDKFGYVFFRIHDCAFL